MITDEKGINGVHLPVLYNFARSVSAVFDIQTLMTHFFNILKTVVDFDAGAYFVCHENHFEGRVYVKSGMEGSMSDEFTAGFSERVAGLCRRGADEARRAIGLSYLTERYEGGYKSSPAHRRDLELKYMGSPAGRVTLVSYAQEDPFEGMMVVEAMAEHANEVLEGLLTHMFAEEKKLAGILLNMSEGVYIIDGAGVCTAVNPKALEMVQDLCDEEDAGAEPSAERGVFSDCDCEFTRCVQRIREAPVLPHGGLQEEIKTARGRVFTLSIGTLFGDRGFIITAKDVTEERLMQKRMMLSSKLASLGEMAAGVAHEINNPLQSILCNIELLDHETNDTGHRRLKRVRDGVLRIKTIIKDLLIFAREQTTETENANLNLAIEKSIEILRHQLRMVNVTTALDLYQKPMIVKINKNMFQQVMINLLQNARDAIEESGTGSKVTIRSRLESGTEAVVEVSDDGPGIPEKIIDRIFDPFFTTKAVGKGTGLGLSVSRKIIEGMGGSITVASVEGQGTLFRVTIPREGAVVDESRAEKRREYDYSAILDKTIMMVDDDEEVLRTVCEAVRPRVASVDAVRSSAAAFERLTEKDYDFIFLDIKMPGMGGIELFSKISEARPRLASRVIFMTGDIESAKTAEFLKFTGCRYLAKPFAIGELLDLVAEIALKNGSVKT